MLIVTAADMEFFPRVQALTKSVLKNTPYKIKVRLVNPSKTAARELPASDRVMIRQDTRLFASEAVKADYCANIRSRIILAELEAGWESVLWLDADSLVRGDITELEHFLTDDGYDTCAVWTGDEEGFRSMECNQYLISTVGVSSIYFARKWRRIQDELESAPGYLPSIMTVQLAYVRAVRSAPWNFKDITYHYSDKHFRPESPIWEAQGQRKFNNEKYLAEERRFRHEK